MKVLAETQSVVSADRFAEKIDIRVTRLGHLRSNEVHVLWVVLFLMSGLSCPLLEHHSALEIFTYDDPTKLPFTFDR